jgi:rubrerythrin
MSDDRLIITDGDADTGAAREYEATRRDLVSRGVLLGGLTVAAAGVPTLLKIGRAFAQADGDVQILERAIDLEQTAAFVYATVYKSGKLVPRFVGPTRLLRDQENEHARALTLALEQLGGTPPAMRARIRQVEGLAEALAGGQTTILEFSLALEEMTVAAYHEAAQRLTDTKLMQTAASIMCNDGQHLVVLRQMLKRNPVPNAFETGEAG